MTRRSCPQASVFQESIIGFIIGYSRRFFAKFLTSVTAVLVYGLDLTFRQSFNIIAHAPEMVFGLSQRDIMTKVSIRRMYVVLSVSIALAFFSITFAAEPEKADPNQAASDVNNPNQKDKRSLPPTHNHPAFNQFGEERQKMVHRQIAGRDVRDPNVLSAMQIAPRHAFVRANDIGLAYDDCPLPIGYGQTISQPYIVAFMTEALALKSDSKVLEIGTGSGYQAAVCAEIAAEVYSIEIIKELAESAEKRLKELGYRNVSVKAGDGYFGWKEKAPFDAIIGTAAAGQVPPPLLEQLKPGGRMILPVEDRLGFQYLTLIIKDQKGNLQKKNVMPVRFVPMTGEVEKNEAKSKR
jgi:protein-L-isoaspartate(D-aspartate) O-methyltransferase